MNTHLNKAIYRLNAVDWKNVGRENKESHALLGCEYLRKAAVFATSLALPISKPVFNAASILGKKPQIDFGHISHVLENIHNPFIRAICNCHLEWCALIDQGEPVAIRFHDLYEPLIKIFERGGIVGFHNGDFTVGDNATFPRKNWLSRSTQKPYDISDTALDKCDELKR